MKRKVSSICRKIFYGTVLLLCLGTVVAKAEYTRFTKSGNYVAFIKKPKEPDLSEIIKNDKNIEEFSWRLKKTPPGMVVYTFPSFNLVNFGNFDTDSVVDTCSIKGKNSSFAAVTLVGNKIKIWLLNADDTTASVQAEHLLGPNEFLLKIVDHNGVIFLVTTRRLIRFGTQSKEFSFQTPIEFTRVTNYLNKEDIPTTESGTICWWPDSVSGHLVIGPKLYLGFSNGYEGEVFIIDLNSGSIINTGLLPMNVTDMIAVNNSSYDVLLSSGDIHISTGWGVIHGLSSDCKLTPLYEAELKTLKTANQHIQSIESLGKQFPVYGFFKSNEKLGLLTSKFILVDDFMGSETVRKLDYNKVNGFGYLSDSTGRVVVVYLGDENDISDFDLLLFSQ